MTFRQVLTPHLCEQKSDAVTSVRVYSYLPPTNSHGWALSPRPHSLLLSQPSHRVQRKSDSASLFAFLENSNARPHSLPGLSPRPPPNPGGLLPLPQPPLIPQAPGFDLAMMCLTLRCVELFREKPVESKAHFAPSFFFKKKKNSETSFVFSSLAGGNSVLSKVNSLGGRWQGFCWPPKARDG